LFQPQIDFHCQGLGFTVQLHEIDTRKRDIIFEDRSVTIETIPLKHRIPCCGYLFREKPLPRHIKRDVIDAYNIPTCYINNIKTGMDFTLPDGEIIPNSILTNPADPTRSYAYCSDTMFAPTNAEQLHNVDLLYHEATFKKDQELLSKKTFHSTTQQAAEMARLSNAKQLMIGHFSARYKNEEELLNECKETFQNTILAEENKCIKL
jgi:ribonuclease Z